MTAYTREPKKMVMHCGICPRMLIYFADDRKKVPLKTRAEIGLRVHRLTHWKGKR